MDGDSKLSHSLDVEPKVKQMRVELASLHRELTRNGLVAWTSGNISGLIPGMDYFLIKPSGVSYDDLTPEKMVLCNLEGEVVEGALGSENNASSDTSAHAYVYRNLEGVGGVVHTHSSYAVAWSAIGEEIPCFVTGMADEFGGPIPMGPFALIGDDSIGKGIVDTLRDHRSRAVLMRNHGPFTIGVTPKDAVKAAVLCEDQAKVAYLARQIGNPIALAESDLDSLYDRYQNVYGQEGDDRR